jgi:hypothetical protein
MNKITIFCELVTCLWGPCPITTARTRPLPRWQEYRDAGDHPWQKPSSLPQAPPGHACGHQSPSSLPPSLSQFVNGERDMGLLTVANGPGCLPIPTFTYLTAIELESPGESVDSTDTRVVVSSNDGTVLFTGQWRIVLDEFIPVLLGSSQRPRLSTPLLVGDVFHRTLRRRENLTARREYGARRRRSERCVTWRSFCHYFASLVLPWKLQSCRDLLRPTFHSSWKIVGKHYEHVTEMISNLGCNCYSGCFVG